MSYYAKKQKKVIFKLKKSQLTISKIPLPAHHPAHHVITFEPIGELETSGELNPTFTQN